jgi:hypothetical protein
MRRRDFVTLIGGAAAWPFASSAQQAVPVVGYLSGRSVNSEARGDRIATFLMQRRMSAFGTKRTFGG